MSTPAAEATAIAGTEAREPKAAVRIERLQEFQAQGEDAIQISFDGDATRFNATIEAASSEDAGLSALTLEIPNMGRDLRKQIDGDGRVEVEAGYASGANELRPQLIFVGTVDRVRVFRRAPDIITRITATSTPAILEEVPAPVTVTTDGGATVANVLERLFNSVGANILLTGSAEQFKVPKGYAATEDVLTEATRLVRALHKATGRPHRLVPASQSSPAQELAGGTRVGSTTFKVVDDGNTDTNERLEVDWSEDTVYEAEPVATRAEPSSQVSPPENTEDSEQLQEQLQTEGNTEEYQVLAPIDPRLALGLPVHVTDEEAGEFGEFTISELTHDLVSLTSEYSGPYRRPGQDDG